MKTSQEMVYLGLTLEALVRLYREDSVEGKELKRWIRSPNKRKFILHAFNMKAQLERESKGVNLYHLKDASMIEISAFGYIDSYGFKYEVGLRDEDNCRIEMCRFSQEEEHLAKYIFLLCSSNKYLESQKNVLDQITRNDTIKYS